MGTASRRRPSSVGDLSTAADGYTSSPDEFEFEFTPLLPQRRRGAVCTECGPARSAGRRGAVCTECGPARSAGCRGAQGALTKAQTAAPQRAAASRVPHQAAAAALTAKARRVRWHEMAFRSVRVPAAMDMGEIRRRLRAPRRGDLEPQVGAAATGWAPWRLIRSLSCKGIEAVAVAAASAPVRLV